MSELLEYKCPCCGGKIEFNSTEQQMKCPFCESVFELEALQAYDDVLNNQPAESEMNWEEEAGSEWQQGESENLRVYKCQSCGGEVVADETTAASKCPYCENPVIMTGQLSGDLKPDLIIPFKLNKEDAKKSLLQHMEGKPLLPKIFKSQNHIDEIKGVYVPVWLFDADVDAHIQYKTQKHKRWSDQQFNYLEKSVFSVTRAGQIQFENVPVDGSEKMDDTMMEALEPFDMKAAVPFQTAYLSGYMADKYDVDAKTSIARANERIENSTLAEFENTVKGYDEVETEHHNLHLNNGEAKYALFPVWLLNTSWNGQKYTFAMNGQTGKFVGDLPSDKGKAFGIFCAVTIGTTILSYIIGTLMGWI
ncbi:MAG: hypothetical protein MJ071_03620 [Oscillospiraceae bacterium]|nr:hypothetical protein [Oscillospiraceae bacterium]